jgi:hypothetical protein
MDNEVTDQEKIKLPAGLCALAGCKLPIYMTTRLYRDHLRSSDEGAILNTLMVLQDMPPGWEAFFGEMVSEVESDGVKRELEIGAVEVPSDEPWILLCRASEMEIVPLWE